MFESQVLVEVKQLVEKKRAVERELGELKAQLEKAGFASLSQMRLDDLCPSPFLDQRIMIDMYITGFQSQNRCLQLLLLSYFRVGGQNVQNKL